MSFLTFKYKVGALDYILKDSGANVKERLGECLKYINDIHSKKVSKEKFLTFKEEDRIINIALNDILFIETSTNSHKIIIHAENSHIEVYHSLRDIESNLTKDFYRCHKSYIVNRKKIKEIDKKNRILIMTNDEQCMASFRYIGGLLK
jgi:two-component system response regulator AgrA